MHRIAIALSIAALVACSSGESTPTASDAEEAPPVSAPAPAEKAAPAPAAPEAPAAAAAPAAEVVTETVGCLDLVSAARFDEAVTVCVDELQVDPDNAELKSALAKAQAAQAGGEAAASEAAGRATSALEGAGANVPGGLAD